MIPSQVRIAETPSGETPGEIESVMSQPDKLDIAIVGWSGGFAGSNRVEALPRRPGEQAPRPAAAGSTLGEVDYFDAPFFGFSPQEAAAMEGARCGLLG